MASLSQGHTAAAQCGLFTHISVPVIFETPYILAIFEILGGRNRMIELYAKRHKYEVERETFC